MTFTLVLAVMAAAPGDVWLDVAADAPCVTAPALATALTARGHRVVKSPGSGLDVRVRGAVDTLTLEAACGERRFERTVPVTAGDCEAVTRVAVALVSAWATKAVPTNSKASSIVAGVTPPATASPAPDSRQATDTPSSRPSASASKGKASTEQRDSTSAPAAASGSANDTTPKGTMTTGEATRGALPDATTTASNTVPSKAKPGQSTTPSNTTSAPADAAPRQSTTSSNTTSVPADATTTASNAVPSDAAPRQITTPSNTTSAPADATSDSANAPLAKTPSAEAPRATGNTRVAPLSLEAIALAGVAFEPLPTSAPVTTAQGHFGVRGALGRWGLLLDGGFESGRTRTLGVATATASSQWLSLSFSVGFRPAARFSLDVALGVRGWRFGATATGVADAAPQTFFTVGGVLSAGLNLQLVGPLQLQLRPWVSLRGSRAAFTVNNLGTVISVEPLAFGALLGAMLRFE